LGGTESGDGFRNEKGKMDTLTTRQQKKYETRGRTRRRRGRGVDCDNLKFTIGVIPGEVGIDG